MVDALRPALLSPGPGRRGPGSSPRRAIAATATNAGACAGVPGSRRSSSRNSSGGRPRKSRSPWPSVNARPGVSARPSSTRPIPSRRQPRVDAPGQAPRRPRSRPGAAPVAGRRRDGPGSPSRSPGRQDEAARGPRDRDGQGEPAQREADQAVEQHRLEEVVGPDVAGLGHQHEPDRDQADPGALLGPDGTGKAVETEAGHHEGQGEEARQAGRQAQRTAGRVEQRQRAEVGVEGVERPHERVVGIERRVLLVQQQTGVDTPGRRRGYDTRECSGRPPARPARPPISARRAAADPSRRP